MARVKAGCRSVFFGSKALGDELVTKYVEALDLEYIPYDGDPSELDKLIHRMDFPEVKRDLLMIIEKMERAFEQSSGMLPALLGQGPSAQDRSATATSARESRLSSRPNDFADCVEQWNGAIARKEAMASRIYENAETISAFFGEEQIEVPDPSVNPETAAIAQATGQELPTVTQYGPLTQRWMQYVRIGDENMRQEELEAAAAKAAADFTFTVEAGSGRVKNRQKQSEDWKALFAAIGPMATQLAQAGMPQQYNALMALASDVFERSMDAFMFPAAQLQPPGTLPQPGMPQQPQEQPPP
jgi:hypothetical protein